MGMRSRTVTALLVLLLVILQAQLWFGRGRVTHVAGLRTELAAQHQRNTMALQVNQQLEAEVRDLTEGLEMVEEKARMELGMVKPNEIFVQYTQNGAVH